MTLENDVNLKATFLDLDIQIENGEYKTQIYDKRDAFKFDIINYPDIDGNIPETLAYSVCIEQLLRYACNNLA